jgi:hypothetical protein
MFRLPYGEYPKACYQGMNGDKRRKLAFSREEGFGQILVIAIF